MLNWLAPRIRDRLLPIGLGQMAGLACGVLGVKIATQLIAPGDYGVYGVFLSFTPLGMWVLHAGLIKSVARNWASSPDRGSLLQEVLRKGAKRLPLLALATGGAAAAVSPQYWFLLWPALFISATLLSVSSLAQTAFQAEKSHWLDCGISIGSSATRSFAPPLLYAYVGGTLLSLTSGFVFHTAVAALGAIYLVTRNPHGRDNAPPQLTRVYDGPLFIMLSLVGWTLTAVNRWIVALFFGADQAGYFTLAGNLALIATSMFGVVVMQYFQPTIFADASEDPARRAALAKKVDLIAACYCVLAVCGVLLVRAVAPILIGPLISETYRPAVAMLVGAGAFGAALTTAQFYHTLLLAGRRERGCGVADTSTAVVLIGGGVVFAAVGQTAFLGWLAACPLVPFLITRSLARRYYFKPA